MKYLYYKKTLKYLTIKTLIITSLFVLLLIFMYIKDGTIIFEPAYVIGSILAATFIISINKPSCYLGFAIGALSSIILFFALYNSNLSMAFSYLIIFLPFQVYTFFVWRNQLYKKVNKASTSMPKFLTYREFLLFILSFTTIYIIHYIIFSTNIILSSLEIKEDNLINSLNSLFFTLSLFANLLLIKKFTDSRILWVLFSLCGIAISLLENSINLYLLFIFIIFLVINIVVLINWIKMTPNKNYGWLSFIIKAQNY